MDSKLIDICYQKYNKKISDSWDTLAKLYYPQSTGEGLRSKFKKYRKANDITNKSIVVEKDNPFTRGLEKEVKELHNYKIYFICMVLLRI